MLVDQDGRAGCLRHQIPVEELPNVFQRRHPRGLTLSPPYRIHLPPPLWGENRRNLPPPLRGENRRHLPPPLWGRVGVGGDRRRPKLEERPTIGALQLVNRALTKRPIAGALDHPEDGAFVAQANLSLG